MSSLLLLVLLALKRFVVGGTNGREGDRSQVSDGKVERMPRARLPLSCVLCVESIRPLSGLSRPPFYRPRGSRDYRREKEEKTRGYRRSFEGVGSFFLLVPALLT